MQIVDNFRGRVSEARQGAKELRSRSALGTFITYVGVVFFNGIIGFFVQLLFFGNVSWSGAWNLITGGGTGGDVMLFVVECVAWELWLIAGIMDWFFVIMLKTNIQMHLPWSGNLPVNLRSPIVPK